MNLITNNEANPNVAYAAAPEDQVPAAAGQGPGTPEPVVEREPELVAPKSIDYRAHATQLSAVASGFVLGLGLGILVLAVSNPIGWGLLVCGIAFAAIVMGIEAKFGELKNLPALALFVIGGALAGVAAGMILPLVSSAAGASLAWFVSAYTSVTIAESKGSAAVASV